MFTVALILSQKQLNRVRHVLADTSHATKAGQCSSTNYLQAKIRSVEDKHLQTLHWTVPDRGLLHKE